MKIGKNELSSKLNRLRGIVPKKSLVRSLEGVLVRQDRIIANDTEVCASIDIAEGFEFIMPAEEMELIGKFPNDDINFEDESTVISVRAGKIRHKFGKLDTVSFPVPPAINVSRAIKMDGEVLQRAMRRVLFAISDHPTNAAMGAMYMKSSGGTLNIIGLSNHVMAWEKIPCGGEFQALVNKTAVVKMLSVGIDKDVELVASGNDFAFVMDGCITATRKVQADYVDVDKFSQEPPSRADIERRPLVDSVQRAAMAAKRDMPSVKLRFFERELTVSAQGEHGDYSESLGLQNSVSGDVSISFNLRFLLEALSSFDGDDVEIDFGSESQPIIIKSDTEYFVMLLPVLAR